MSTCLLSLCLLNYGYSHHTLLLLPPKVKMNEDTYHVVPIAWIKQALKNVTRSVDVALIPTIRHLQYLCRI